MRSFTMIIAVLAITVSARSAVIHVPQDHSTIQEALDAAQNGDTILVDPGTYIELIDFKGKAITVRSSDGAESTTIDASSVS